MPRLRVTPEPLVKVRARGVAWLRGLIDGGRFHHSSSRQLRHVAQWAHMIYSVSMLHTITSAGRA